jgi:hypothetical protein
MLFTLKRKFINNISFNEINNEILFFALHIYTLAPVNNRSDHSVSPDNNRSDRVSLNHQADEALTFFGLRWIFRDADCPVL